eukprot:scaffold166961_cov63-Attheya_sp.AAC.1
MVSCRDSISGGSLSQSLSLFLPHCVLGHAMSFGYCICSPVNGPNHGYVRARSIRLDQVVLTPVEG